MCQLWHGLSAIVHLGTCFEVRDRGKLSTLLQCLASEVGHYCKGGRCHMQVNGETMTLSPSNMALPVKAACNDLVPLVFDEKLSTLLHSEGLFALDETEHPLRLSRAHMNVRNWPDAAECPMSGKMLLSAGLFGVEKPASYV
eukprot:1118556-Amphidinium_carterae.2